MHREPDRDFFLLAAMDWAAVRATAPPGSRAYRLASTLSREAAYLHLLFQAGKTTRVLRRLGSVGREFLGASIPCGAAADAARTLATAADLFHRLRLAARPASCVGAA